MNRSRIAGLDVARAVALLGMFAAHVGNASVATDAGWPWLAVTHGRSAALFAVLAGVSIALMLVHRGGDRPTRGDVAHTRVRVAVRGGMLIALGALLTGLGTPVDVILDNLGVMFVMVLVAFRWRPSVLAASGVAFLVGGRALVLWAAPAIAAAGAADVPVVHELWSEHYPALIWVGYLLVGMAVGKLAPWEGRRVVVLGGAGVLLAVAGYGAGIALGGRSGADWASVAPHSYTAFETMGDMGVALATIAAALVVSRALPRATWPFAAAGMMTLTLYTAHIAVIAVVGSEMVWEPSNSSMIALCAASLAFASAWRWRLGQGPLERTFTRASTAAADAAVGRSRLHAQLLHR